MSDNWLRALLTKSELDKMIKSVDDELSMCELMTSIMSIHVKAYRMSTHWEWWKLEEDNKDNEHEK